MLLARINPKMSGIVYLTGTNMLCFDSSTLFFLLDFLTLIWQHRTNSTCILPSSKRMLLIGSSRILVPCIHPHGPVLVAAAALVTKILLSSTLEVIKRGVSRLKLQGFQSSKLASLLLLNSLHEPGVGVLDNGNSLTSFDKISSTNPSSL